MFRENNLKKLLNSGGKALGCWTSMDSPITTEILAEAGFDFLLIDHEHGYGDSKGLAVQLQAMAGTNTSSLLRVPELRTRGPHHHPRLGIRRCGRTTISCWRLNGVICPKDSSSVSWLSKRDQWVNGMLRGNVSP